MGSGINQRERERERERICGLRRKKKRERGINYFKNYIHSYNNRVNNNACLYNLSLIDVGVFWGKMCKIDPYAISHCLMRMLYAEHIDYRL